MDPIVWFFVSAFVGGAVGACSGLIVAALILVALGVLVANVKDQGLDGF